MSLTYDKSIEVWSLVGLNRKTAEKTTANDLELGITETCADIINTGDVEIYDGINIAK